MPCTPSCYSLEDRICQGTDPDHPEYLYAYLSTAQECALQLTQPHRRQLYIQVFRTLMTAAANDDIALHWRMLCLEHACFPLCRLRSLSRTCEQQQELLQLRRQLASIGHSFR